MALTYYQLEPPNQNAKFYFNEMYFKIPQVKCQLFYSAFSVLFNIFLYLQVGEADSVDRNG